MGCVFCPDCSPLRAYRVAWQKQMDLEISFLQVGTEEHKDVRKRGRKIGGKKKSLWKYRRGKCLWNSPRSFDHSCFSYWQQFLFSMYSEERKDGFFLCVVLVSLKKSNPRWYTKKRKSGGIKNRMWLISRGRKKLRK